MVIDPVSGIRVLDATLDYADTSEDRVLAVLKSAADRSSRSDELANAMVDWPTRYHFSRMRAHLIRPFTIRANLDVLDVGCGTGAVTRAIGETGARVLGIEGALPRARAAALRCADLENVEIICGDVSNLAADRTFDLACLVGVLEYAAAAEGGAHGPEALLAHLRTLVKPDGAVLVAIENQIGLKYLLGYREDHVGLPWAGVEDYGEGFGARTWSRRQLGRMLTRAGFAAQRWFFPFPDYKLPAAILAEGAFALDGAAEIVDQIVRRPVHDFAYPRTVLTDDRRVHNVLLNAGIGPEIANSFLVVAAADDASLDTLDDRRSIAWILGGERRAAWKRTQVLARVGTELRISATADSGGDAARHDAWLSQHPGRDDPWLRGPTLEQLVLEACHVGDENGLASALGLWRDFLSEQLMPHQEAGVDHPFAPAPNSPALPPDMLDVSPSNFVLSDRGVVFIDREWHVEGGVDLLLASLRALWFLALDLVQGGARHLWSDDLTVDQMCCTMANMCGLSADADDLERMVHAEASLQSLVIGFDCARVTRDLKQSGSSSLADPNAICPTRWTHLHEFADGLLTNAPRFPTALGHDRDTAHRHTEDRDTSPGHDEDKALPTSIDHDAAIASLERKAEALQAKISRLENLLVVRIYNRFRWLISGR